MRKGEYDKAVESFSRSLELNPGFTEAYFNRGVCYVQKQGYDRAIADFNQAIAKNLEYIDAYNNRGSVYAFKEEYDRAINDFNTVLFLDSNNKPAKKNLQLAMDAKAKKEGKGADTTRTFVDYYNYGIAAMREKNYDNAVEAFSQAIKLNPKYPIAYFNRGLSYTDKGNHDLAIEDFTKAIKLGLNHAYIYYNRGLSYESKGDNAHAISDYKQALALDGNHILAMEKLQKAKKIWDNNEDSQEKGIRGMFFTSNGRLNRKKYYLRTLALIVVECIALTIRPWVPSALLPVMIIVPIISFVLLMMRRLHDLDKPGWWALPMIFVGMVSTRPKLEFFVLFFIAFILYITFAKGTSGPNSYGPDPLISPIMSSAE